MKTFFLHRINCVIFIYLFASCSLLPAVGENYQKPKIAMPQNWQSLDEDQEDFVSELESAELIEQDWWKSFKDPILEKAVAIAIKNNYDFKIAQSRVLEARANVTSKTSDLGPKVSATTSATRRNNYINPINPNSHKTFNFFTAGFDASWEIDLFGSNRRAREAAKAAFESTAAEKNSTLISLIAEVAKNYSILRNYQKQLSLQKQINGLYHEIFELGLKKNHAGLLSDIDLSRLKIDLLNSEQNLSENEGQVFLALYNLEFLLGEKPGTLKDFFGEVGEVPILAGEIFLDAPANLLQNRPDIIQAERQLASATALKGYSIAQIFPKISLSGFFGFYNTKSQSLLKSPSRVFSEGVSITTPILDFGSIFAGIKISEQRKKQALISYESQINKALVDVESALINFVKEDEKLFLNLQNNEIFKMIEELNKKRYEQGIISYLDWLHSKIELLKANQKLSSGKLDFTTKSIALYKSLGGGWKKISDE